MHLSLLSLNFWFDLTPDPFLPQSLKILQLAFGALILLGVAVKIISMVRKTDYTLSRGGKKLFKIFLTMGIFGFFILFMEYERVPFLSSRFWYALWFLGFAVWSVFVIIYILKKLPAQKQEMDESERLKKWLPKKK